MRETRTATQTIPVKTKKAQQPTLVVVEGQAAPAVLLDDLWLLPVIDVATRLSYSRDLVYDLIKDGRIEALDTDGGIRVTPDALRRYLATLPARVPHKAGGAERAAL